MARRGVKAKARGRARKQSRKQSRKEIRSKHQSKRKRQEPNRLYHIDGNIVEELEAVTGAIVLLDEKGYHVKGIYEKNASNYFIREEAGKFRDLGGFIEEKETPPEALAREFSEELPEAAATIERIIKERGYVYDTETRVHKIGPKHYQKIKLYQMILPVYSEKEFDQISLAAPQHDAGTIHVLTPKEVINGKDKFVKENWENAVRYIHERNARPFNMAVTKCARPSLEKTVSTYTPSNVINFPTPNKTNYQSPSPLPQRSAYQPVLKAA